MATFNKFQQFVENLGKGVHDFTDDASCSVTVALSTVIPTAGMATLSEITEVEYTNLSSRIVTGITWEHTTGTVTMTATDLVLTASGAVAGFQYVTLYDDDPTSPADPLIGWYDYGSVVTLASGETFTIDFTSILTLV